MGDELQFGPFRLDLATARVWRGSQALKLTAKALAVLRYLATHPGQLVTKAELFAAVWPQTVVSDAALAVCIRELRHVLADDARAPRYIETVHRQGYRFVASFHDSPAAATILPSGEEASRELATGVVGRDREFQQLQDWLTKALAGQRQLVFVTGEAGIGKTALVDAFCAQMRVSGGVWLGQGHCIEHVGTGEAYLSVLTALEQLCQLPALEQVCTVLRQYAPTWLLQLPGVLSAAEQAELQQQTAGVTRERMLREIAGALERLTTLQPLVLVLEDLHWSDAATLDLLAYLARRPQPARLLVLGTYRPVEIIVRDHPLRAVHHELQLHGRCAELPLGGLSAADVQTYLARCFPGHRFPEGVGQALYARTEGNPLFLTTVVNEWVAQGEIVSEGDHWLLRRDITKLVGQIPDSLRQLVLRQLERLSAEEREVAEAASVAGVEFSAAAVAAAVDRTLVMVETQCEAFAQRQMLIRPYGVAVWPDGTVAARYYFLHALYQEIVYAQVAAGRRRLWHQRIGDREEAAYGDYFEEIAAELAVHFEQGREYAKAVRALEQAGKNAMGRSAPHEALRFLSKGVELLMLLPETTERRHQALTLHVTLGTALIAAQGYAAPGLETVYTHAQELCAQVGTPTQAFVVQCGIWLASFERADLQQARDLAEQLLQTAHGQYDPVFLVSAHCLLGATLLWLGEFSLARTHLEQAANLYERSHHQPHTALHGQDMGVRSASLLPCVLWVLGYPDHARVRSHAALTLAQEVAHPLSLAHTLFYLAAFQQLCLDTPAAYALAEEEITLCAEYGLPYWGALGSIVQGWTLVKQGQRAQGLARIHQGWAAYQGGGGALRQPYYLAVLADVYGESGRAEEGLRVLTEAFALVDRAGAHLYEAELYRLKGELLLQQAKGQTPAHRTSLGSGRVLPAAASALLESGEETGLSPRARTPARHRQKRESSEQ